MRRFHYQIGTKSLPILSSQILRTIAAEYLDSLGNEERICFGSQTSKYAPCPGCLHDFLQASAMSPLPLIRPCTNRPLLIKWYTSNYGYFHREVYSFLFVFPKKTNPPPNLPIRSVAEMAPWRHYQLPISQLGAKLEPSWSEAEILAEQPGGPPWRDGDGELSNYLTT